jgi:hypothetical protein
LKKLEQVLEKMDVTAVLLSGLLMALRAIKITDQEVNKNEPLHND